MLRQATIVFDLDGTLVDTAPDLSNALNDVMTRRGHAPVPAATVRACVGHGARVMIEQALRLAGAVDDIDQMLAEFLIHYEANIAAESRPFPGAVTALESLSDQGATLAVCTNKREYLPRKLLRELDLARYFSGLAGRDTFGFSKPWPAARPPGPSWWAIARSIWRQPKRLPSRWSWSASATPTVRSRLSGRRQGSIISTNSKRMSPRCRTG